MIYGCHSITCVDLPSTVTYIDYMAFGPGSKHWNSYEYGRCANLTSIIIRSTTPPSVEEDFEDDGLPRNIDYVYVPNGCSETYKADSFWGQYKSRITELPSN